MADPVSQAQVGKSLLRHFCCEHGASSIGDKIIYSRSMHCDTDQLNNCQEVDALVSQLPHLHR